MGMLSYIGCTFLAKCCKGNFGMSRFFRTNKFQHKLNFSSCNESYCGQLSKRSPNSIYMAFGINCKTKIGMSIIGSKGFMYSSNFVSIAKRSSSSIHFNSIEYYDAEAGIFLNQNSNHIVKVFIIDIETTGLSRERDRVVEIAIRDLQGGKNSCFTTLVNPEKTIPNSEIHNIKTEMVKQTGAPRMKELIPILLEYIKSRLLHGEQPLFVAHNARSFDAQFLIKEFHRNSYDVPWDWLFIDTLPLSREAMKLKGLWGPTKPKLTLLALSEHYRIPLVGTRHRAMPDVNLLSEIFRRLIEDLNLSASDLLNKSFRLSDIINQKQKLKP